VCIKDVESCVAYVGPSVMIMLVTSMLGGDGKDFLAGVRDESPLGSIIWYCVPCWEFRNRSSRNGLVEDQVVDEGIHCRSNNGSGPTIHTRLGAGGMVLS
jgi:hypothetical protein